MLMQELPLAARDILVRFDSAAVIVVWRLIADAIARLP